MSKDDTGVKAHDDTCTKSEGILQSATVGATQAAINAAAITHYRNVVKSALANGCGVEPAMTALRSLGVTGQ